MTEKLCESVSDKVFSKKMKAVLIILGIYLELISFYLMLSGTPFSKLFHILFVGIVCFYLTTFELRIYITKEGLVRSSRTLFNKKHEVLPWNDVSYVTLVKRKDLVTAYFARFEEMGWKLKFKEEQFVKMKKILSKYLSDEKIMKI